MIAGYKEALLYEFRDTLQLLDMRGRGVSHALIESYLLRHNISGLKKWRTNGPISFDNRF